MAKHILTQEDLDNNPDLVEQGLSVGDEIDRPEEGTEDFTEDETPDEGLAIENQDAVASEKINDEDANEPTAEAQKPMIIPPGASEPIQ